MKSMRLAIAVALGFVLSFAVLLIVNPAVLPIALAAPAADIRYVSDYYGADVGDCTDQSNPCLTVQYALAQAVGGDTIRVANSYAAAVYVGTLTIDKSSGLYQNRF